MKRRIRLSGLHIALVREPSVCIVSVFLGHAYGNELAHLMVVYWVMVVPLGNRRFGHKFDQKVGGFVL